MPPRLESRHLILHGRVDDIVCVVLVRKDPLLLSAAHIAPHLECACSRVAPKEIVSRHPATQSAETKADG